MPKLEKTFTLEVKLEQFLNACSPLELKELDLLLSSDRYQKKMEFGDARYLPEEMLGDLLPNIPGEKIHARNNTEPYFEEFEKNLSEAFEEINMAIKYLKNRVDKKNRLDHSEVSSVFDLVIGGAFRDFLGKYKSEYPKWDL